MRKILSVVLALTLVLGSFSFVFAAPNDVAGTKYEDAVEELMTLGIVDGYGDGTIRPNQTIKREEFAKLIVVALGLEDLTSFANDTTQFTDVPENSWAKGYINIAAGQGLVKGRGDGTFGYGDNITYGEVITIILRALGYDDSLPGQWPYDYIVKAKDLGVTDDVTVSTGAAIRGDVFLLVDNSLRVPMVEKDEDGIFVEDEDETLLAKVGFDKITGVMTSRVNDDDEITLVDADGKEHVVIVSENFDSEANFGLELTVWVNGDDEVKLFEANDTPLLDALAWDGDNEELKLVEADEAYEVSEDATLYLNGEEVDVDDVADLDGADYAKVVLNDDEVVFVDAYTWDAYMVVEEVDDAVVYSYGEDLDVEDYTIVKEGKTIDADDIEEGDILFYNEDLAYAEVFNSTEAGELDDIYSDTFELEGEEYTIDGYYVDGSSLVTLDADALLAMEEEGDVTVFFNREGNVVFVEGDLGEADTSIFAGILTDDAFVYQNRAEDYLGIDIVNENGDEESYDFDADILDANDYVFDTKGTSDSSDDDIDKNEYNTDGTVNQILIDDAIAGGYFDQYSIVEFEVDEDGDVVAFYELDMVPHSSGDVKIDAKYIEGKKLTDSTLVFLKDANDDFTVFPWDEAEDHFGKLSVADVYYNSDDYVTYLYVETSNTDADEEYELAHAFVKEVKELADDSGYRTTFVIDNEEYTLDIDTDLTAKVYNVVKVFINEEMDAVDEGHANAFDVLTATEEEIDEIDLRNETFTVVGDTTEYELLSDAYIFDVNDEEELILRDVKEGDKVTFYSEANGSSRFVEFLLVDPSTTPTVGDLTFDPATDTASINSATLVTPNVSRSVTVDVYADITWDATVTNYEVTIDEALVNASGVTARSITGENYNSATNTISFTIVFDEDVYVGDTLEIKENAITVTGKDASLEKVQSATNKAVEIDITN